MVMSNIIYSAMIPQIPIAEWTEKTTKLITSTFSFIFKPIQKHFGSFMDWTSDTLGLVPPVVLIIIVAILAFIIKKRLGLAAFSVVGLWLINNQGYWTELIDTFFSSINR